MAFLRLCLPHVGTRKLEWPDDDLPVIRSFDPRRRLSSRRPENHPIDAVQLRCLDRMAARSQGTGLPTNGPSSFQGDVMEFWTEPQMASIHKMLNPRSIAIVGATPRMQYGGRFLAAALKVKDRVRVYAVNPRYDEIMGVKSYRSVTDLPEAPDVVGIVVPYDQVLAVLQESHRKGVGSAIVISAGFAERDVDDRRA